MEEEDKEEMEEKVEEEETGWSLKLLTTMEGLEEAEGVTLF